MDAAARYVIDRFLARLDEVVERCTAAVWETLPSYASFGEALMGDLRQAVRENVGILGEVLSEGRGVSADELRAIERVGARRAEAGIPLEDVLHAYRTVSRVCWDVLAEECRSFSDDGLESAIALAQALLRYTDDISAAAADAYVRAQRAIVREREGARRQFLADLLYGTDVAPENLLRRARTFGYDLSLSYLALVGLGPQTERGNEAAVSAAASGLELQAAEPIVLQKGEQTVALVPADPAAPIDSLPERLAGELGGGWRFGTGGPEAGLDGIRRAYLEAREALEIGAALELPGPVHRFGDLLVYHFLRNQPRLVERFVEQTLGALIDYDTRRKGELVKTLEAYFAVDESVKMTAKGLFTHPHTISYRLKQVEKLTQWSLHEPEHKLRLQLALRARRLAQARPAPRA